MDTASFSARQRSFLQDLEDARDGAGVSRKEALPVLAEALAREVRALTAPAAMPELAAGLRALAERIERR